MREHQVRFCERLGGRFPEPTRQMRKSHASTLLPLRNGVTRQCPWHPLGFAVQRLRWIEDALESIHAYGVEAAITRHAWGSAIEIHDPDGNRIGIRDELTFKDQLRADW